MWKAFFKWLLFRLYKIDVHGLQHYHDAGKKVLLVANLQSRFDALLLSLVLPDCVSFCLPDSESFFIFNHFNFKKLDYSDSQSVDEITQALAHGHHHLVFPEGKITTTGALMAIQAKPMLMAYKAQAAIVPVHIEGTLYTPFSKIKGQVPCRWFPKVTIHFFPAHKLETLPKKNKAYDEKRLALMLYDIMREAVFCSANKEQTLFQSLIAASHLYGANHVIAHDVAPPRATYRTLLMHCFILGKKLAQETKGQAYVGVLLPSTLTCLTTFFALQAYGRVPAMLNFSNGIQSLLSSCQTASMSVIYTARKFVKAAKLSAMIWALEQAGIKIIYLEDVAQSLTKINKIQGFLASCVPHWMYKRVAARVSSKDTAVVLFTSGSEGTPKGVALSHENIQANCYQVTFCYDFKPTDIVLNALPLFHSFGLTCGAILPVLSGMRVVFYPSPIHYQSIPKIVYAIGATIIFGTDTFLTGYARYAGAYDFHTVRYVFAGGEKLKEITSQIWMKKYGIRLFEGYGATETSPVIAFNTPMHYKQGTVGRFVPCVKPTLKHIPGIQEGQRLFVKGPNIMAGYLSGSDTKINPPSHQTYDTGDVVSIDTEGYITIKGRVKRFAKVAGEMVSLTAVELFLSQLWPQNHHAVFGVPDTHKGEVLAMVTDNKSATLEEVRTYGKKHGMSMLCIPKHLKIIDAIPLLGTGKIDYVQVEKMSRKLLKNIPWNSPND